MRPGLILLMLFCFALPLSAQELGRLFVSQGRVKVQGPQGVRLLDDPSKSLGLSAQDEIHTGPQATATLRLSKGLEEIRLYSNSYLALEQYAEEQRQVALPIGKAKFNVHYGNLQKRPQFRIKTTNALVGVKGTEFVVQVRGNTTNLLTLDGVVQMANLKAPEAAVEIARFEVSQTQGQKAPKPPASVPPEVSERIVAADSFDLGGWQDAGLETPAPTPEERGEQRPHESEDDPEDSKPGASKSGDSEPGTPAGGPSAQPPGDREGLPQKGIDRRSMDRIRDRVKDGQTQATDGAALKRLKEKQLRIHITE